MGHYIYSFSPMRCVITSYRRPLVTPPSLQLNMSTKWTPRAVPWWRYDPRPQSRGDPYQTYYMFREAPPSNPRCWLSCCSLRRVVKSAECSWLYKYSQTNLEMYALLVVFHVDMYFSMHAVKQPSSPLDKDEPGFGTQCS